MDENVEFNNLEEALNRCGASWDAAQTHGLLTGRLAVIGVPAGPDWLLQVLEGTEDGSVLRRESEGLLDTLYQSTFGNCPSACQSSRHSCRTTTRMLVCVQQLWHIGAKDFCMAWFL